jgi:excisionase family DNA binding protein
MKDKPQPSKPLFSVAERFSAFNAAPDEALFDQKTVAALRGCSEATLERDRWAGGGIPFVRIGRSVRYRKRDVLTWLEQHPALSSTSEADAMAKESSRDPY